MPRDKVCIMGDTAGGRFTKSYYWDPVAMETACNLRVCYNEATLAFRMNDLGFRSTQDRDEGRPLTVVWGDSVVFGQGERTWVDMLEKFRPGVQFLNGGVEGLRFPEILDLAEKRNAEFQIDYNIMMPGWHGWDGREADLRLWERVAQLPGPAFMTVPSLLNEMTIKEDWDEYIWEKNGGKWKRPQHGGMEGSLRRFWGKDDFRATSAGHLDKILHRNYTCRTAARQMSIPLCDMWMAMAVSTLAQGVPYFQDMGHPEPDAYPWMAEIVWRSLKHEI